MVKNHFLVAVRVAAATGIGAPPSPATAEPSEEGADPPPAPPAINTGAQIPLGLSGDDSGGDVDTGRAQQPPSSPALPATADPATPSPAAASSSPANSEPRQQGGDAPASDTIDPAPATGVGAAPPAAARDPPEPHSDTDMAAIFDDSPEYFDNDDMIELDPPGGTGADYAQRPSSSPTPPAAPGEAALAAASPPSASSRPQQQAGDAPAGDTIDSARPRAGVADVATGEFRYSKKSERKTG